MQKDADAADIVKLINLSEYAEGSDRMTFFMPSGDRAAKTLLSLTKGELGPLTSPHGSSEYKRELRQACFPFILVLPCFSERGLLLRPISV